MVWPLCLRVNLVEGLIPVNCARCFTRCCRMPGPPIKSMATVYQPESSMARVGLKSACWPVPERVQWVWSIPSGCFAMSRTAGQCRTAKSFASRALRRHRSFTRLNNPLIVKVSSFWSRSSDPRLDFWVVHPWLGEDIETNTSSERQDPFQWTRSLGAADASATRQSYSLAVIPLMISITRGVEGSAAGESA